MYLVINLIPGLQKCTMTRDKTTLHNKDKIVIKTVNNKNNINFWFHTGNEHWPPG